MGVSRAQMRPEGNDGLHSREETSLNDTEAEPEGDQSTLGVDSLDSNRHRSPGDCTNRQNETEVSPVLEVESSAGALDLHMSAGKKNDGRDRVRTMLDGTSFSR